MRHTFELPVRPMSINSSYHSFGKTQQFRDWTHSVFHYLDKSDNQKKLAELRDAFDPKTHGLRFAITLFSPDLYVKSGELSGRVVDCSNYEKAVLDAFCLAKYAEKPAPYGVKNLMIDDKFVTRLFSQKKLGADWSLRVSITVCKK